MSNEEKLDAAVERIYSLSRLWSICDLLSTHIKNNDHGKIWGLTPTITALVEECRPLVDPSIAEEGVRSDMNYYAANTIRKMVKHYPMTKEQMLEYAQSVEDDG